MIRIILTINHDGIYAQFDVINEILYFYTQDRKIVLVNKQGRAYHFTHSTITKLEKQLRDADFCKIRRAVIINCDTIRGYSTTSQRDTFQLILKKEYEASVSEKSAAHFLFSRFYLARLKNIFIIIIMMLTIISASSQVLSALRLRVYKHTNCVQYFSLIGSEICDCNAIYTSSIVAIAPGSIITYEDSTTIGGTLPSTGQKGIVASRIFDSINFCMSNAGVIGQSVCGFAQTFYFDALGANCAVCSHTRAHWFEALTSCGDEMATLIFSS